MSFKEHTASFCNGKTLVFAAEDEMNDPRALAELMDKYSVETPTPEYEERYTSKGGGSLADYIRDVLTLLVEKKVLSEQETKPFWSLLAGADRETT